MRLSRNAHVRGDMLYRLWPPRMQATLDLILYFLFFFPGILALIYAGFGFAKMSWMFKEVSVFSPAGAPIFPLKGLIPLDRRIAVHPGHRGSLPLHPVHPHRRLAAPAA